MRRQRSRLCRLSRYQVIPRHQRRIGPMQWGPQTQGPTMTKKSQQAPAARRSFLARSLAFSLSPFVLSSTTYAETMTTSSSIRPFTVPTAPQSKLDDLRRRVAATVWPEGETVSDASQGVQRSEARRVG